MLTKGMAIPRKNQGNSKDLFILYPFLWFPLVISAQ